MSCKTAKLHRRGRDLLFSVAGAAILASVPLSGAFASAIDNAPTFGNSPALGNADSLDNPPASEESSDYLLADVMPLSDSELSKYRGGFSVGNLDINFGFSVKTAIEGPHIHPFMVTTNFTVDRPGHVRNLGSKVSDGPSHHDWHPPINKVSLNVPSNTPSDPEPSQHHNSPSSPDTTVLASNTVTPPPTHTTPTTQSTPTPTPHSPPVVIQPTPSNEPQVQTSPPQGPQLMVDTSNGGILTTIKNNANGLTFTSQVDLNYVVNNYHDVVVNSRRVIQAAKLADQMLAIHGFGH